ncbi:MAG: DUF2256 domain-containing protein [Gammaproteobacteria bacterium]
MTTSAKPRYRKSELPSRICVQCQRPFSWRKKWWRVWNEVRYCSDRCRHQARHASTPPNACAAGSVEDEF